MKLQQSYIRAYTFFSAILYLRRLRPIFQALAPLCLTLHNFGCSACTKKSQCNNISKIELMLCMYVLSTSPLP